MTFPCNMPYPLMEVTEKVTPDAQELVFPLPTAPLQHLPSRFHLVENG